MISVDTLPDDVLLAIFDYYVNGDAQDAKEREEAWQSLVHVCRRWRSIVFGSPRHLKLRLVCQERTPARDRLDVWPALPLIIESYDDYRIGNVDNIVAVLERSDRVCQIILPQISNSDLEILLAAMQRPFPELTDLSLFDTVGEMVPVVSDSFLGGSAPRLKHLWLDRIPFLALRKLILSAPHLVTLYLENTPHSGYISPEAMVTALSSLTGLEILRLEFQSPRSCPDQANRRSPPSTHSVLPVLRHFTFKGVSEYLEDLVARIDAPLLNSLQVTFFNDTVFYTPQIMQFISRTPTSRGLENAIITVWSRDASLVFSSRTFGDGDVSVRILCQGLDWQLSSVEQVCTSCLPPLSTLEDLYIHDHRYSQPDWEHDIENGLWLQLLHSFTAVKNLYIGEEIALLIGPALQELSEGRTTEVLPALQNIFLKGLEPSGPVQEGIRQFVASRQVTSRPIAVSLWDDSNS